MTTQEIIDYYKSLLILQYRAMGNALAHVDALILEIIQDQIVSKVRDAFDVTTAIGAQLNILGTYRGIARTLFGVTPGSYWSLVPYADAAPASYFGWAEYADADPTWGFLQYADLSAVAYALTDSQMRRLIQLQAAFQSSDGTLGNLDNVLYAFFGSYVNAIDNEDMTITYEHQTADPDIDGLWGLAVIAGILPHGAGVSYSVVEV